MIEKKRPRVIILENDEVVQKHVAAILVKQGWAVTCEQVSKDALNTLERAEKLPFALFISNFKLPKMEGDDILERVKSISPLTQRMLMVPADKPDTLIKAINKAEINACIISPFNDEDLIYLSRDCFKQFKHAIKAHRLKRVTRHQNQQMFKIAQKLKKKDTAYRQLINTKQAQKFKLKSTQRNIESKEELGTKITLSHLLEHREIPHTREAFNQEFLVVCEAVKTLFNQATDPHGLPPLVLDLKKILKQDTLSADTFEKDKTDSGMSGRDTPGPAPDPPPEGPARTSLMDDIIKTAFSTLIKTEISDVSPQPVMDHAESSPTDNRLEQHFDLSVAQDQTRAFLRKIKDFSGTDQRPDVAGLLDLLRQRQISYGILDNEAIEVWITKSFTEQVVIAQGEAPVFGRDGRIKFHFQTDFTHPGKISEDGSIDFRDRGDIPHVSAGDLLAQKTLPQEGRPGISVFGTPIPVDEVIDPVFTAGHGAELSDDGLEVHAAIDGQPHCDALGTLSVNPELVIPGDVDFETGNIDFKGNIVVKGMIKEGFCVKGMNLTVQEVEGGTIDLSGDLNVSAGITDSVISVQGNIVAKFINHSQVMGFGNLTISKEIIDSKITLSGACLNSTGHIISSQISAKLGVEAGKVGTSASKPSKLIVGVDEHIDILTRQINGALETSVTQSGALRDEIKRLEDEDQALYRTISEKAHIQDRSQIEIKALKKSLPELEASNDMAKLSQTSKEIKRLVERGKNAESELNLVFESQDRIAKQVDLLKEQITRLEEKNKDLVIEKKALKAFSQKNTARPIVTVVNTITQDSIIKGPHSSLILKEDASRCKIQELAGQEDSLQFFEMMISDL